MLLIFNFLYFSKNHFGKISQVQGVDVRVDMDLTTYFVLHRSGAHVLGSNPSHSMPLSAGRSP